MIALMTKHLLYIAIFALGLIAVPQQAEAAMSMELIEVDQQPELNVAAGKVHVTGAANLTLYVYNVAGVCVQSIKIDGPDRCFDLNLPKGCYIFKVGKVARKVSIK